MSVFPLSDHTPHCPAKLPLLLHPPPRPGNVLNYSERSGLDAAELARCAARLLQLLDLGGHERFSKTALHGLTCTLPDYVMLCVNVATGERDVQGRSRARAREPARMHAHLPAGSNQGQQGGNAPHLLAAQHGQPRHVSGYLWLAGWRSSQPSLAPPSASLQGCPG